MKVFLAGVESLYPENVDVVADGYNLVSFYSMNKIGEAIVRKSKQFLLDSGAFTFMKGGG